MQDQDDAVLAARAAGGDTSAFEALVSRYERVLFRVAHRMLGDYADAADATQTAFVKAYQKLGSFDPRFRFYSWIYRILLNECLNARRDARALEPIRVDLAGAGSPHDDVEARERRQLVQRALMKLPPEYRQVIVLRHFGELSVRGHRGDRGHPGQDGQIETLHGTTAADGAADRSRSAMNTPKEPREGGAEFGSDSIERLLDELKAADSHPAGLRGEVMRRIRVNQGRLVEVPNGDRRMAKKVLIGLAAAATVVIIVFAAKGWPPAGKGTEATIGAAKRHQAQQMSAADVTLGDPATQEFLQSELGDRLMKDPDARSLLGNAGVREALANAQLRAALSNAQLRDALANATVRDALASAQVRQALASAAVRDALSNASMRAAFANASVVQALSNAQVRDALAKAGARALDADAVSRFASQNAQLRAALQDKSFREAISSGALSQALASNALAAMASTQALGQALTNAAFRDAVASGAMGRALENGAIAQAMSNAKVLEAISSGALAQAMNNAHVLQALNNDAFAKALGSDAFAKALDSGMAAR